MDNFTNILRKLCLFYLQSDIQYGILIFLLSHSGTQDSLITFPNLLDTLNARNTFFLPIDKVYVSLFFFMIVFYWKVSTV